jgi:hypothetical protein
MEFTQNLFTAGYSTKQKAMNFRQCEESHRVYMHALEGLFGSTIYSPAAILVVFIHSLFKGTSVVWII